ncbi:hypothetical protein GCM10010123_14910 [Pilimelia anulata]|uniref:PPIase cyclophilin-type domain-containing protein n=1 Tax=Pilimelia anulata TaxID=53371 RepID=A0A8J3F774_9ACTN|nr:peptidylprolyl isomerase [Pilimelia anulata]GGJ86334.1 hypothetical protein GCM10010123_14910 [Pilimelia anulata]
MASGNERARALARSKRQRQLARRAEQVRRRRQLVAGIATGLAVLLVVVGAFWFFGGDDDPRPGAGGCDWTRLDPAADSNLRDVGEPPRRGNPAVGDAVLTASTNQGQLDITLEQGTAPCGVASLRHLAGRGFFNNTTCHALTPEYLRCGDPTGTGAGGPTYGVLGENLPAPAPAGSPSPAGDPQYLRGTIALVRNNLGTYGSQFAIVYKDIRTSDPTLAPVGYLTAGINHVDRVVKAGTAPGGTKPKTALTLTSVTVEGGIPNQPIMTVTPTATPTPSASPR